MRLFLATLLLSVFGLASVATAQIAGSAHDLSSKPYSGGEICVVCHAPHNNQNTQGDVLWNRVMTATVFDLYSSETLDATTQQPAQRSLLCLGCHDGTIAIDSFAGGSSEYVTGGALIGTDLSNNHPVSIPIDQDTDGNINLNPALPTFSGLMECATCHDVHNDATFGKLLRIDMTGSALCQECHQK